MGELESLDTDEPLARRLARHDFDRLVMLSDGVFAIAMTLLALEVKPEHAPSETADGAVGGAETLPDLWRSLAPSVAAFALSFAVIGIFWLTHKRLFARLQRVDGRLSALGLLLLGEIALLPPATALLYRSGPAQPWPLYLGLIGLIGLTQAAMWAYAAFVGKLIHEEVSMRFRIVAMTSNALAPVTLAATILYATSARSPLVWLVAGGLMAAYLGLRGRLTAPRRVKPGG